MSRHWEHIIWQNKDGQWGVGFYERISTGNHADEDYDSEWDDEFDRAQFCFASTGHASEEQAMDSWPGANPGYRDICPYSRDAAKEIAEWEDMAKAYASPEYAEERRKRQERALKTAQRKRVRESVRKDPPREGNRCVVRIGRENAYTSYTVTLTASGDWLGFLRPKMLKSGKPGKPTFVKVWNTATQNPGPDVASLKIHPSSFPVYRW